MLRSNGLTIRISWVLLNLRNLKSAWGHHLFPSTPIDHPLSCKTIVPYNSWYEIHLTAHIFSLIDHYAGESQSISDWWSLYNCRLPLLYISRPKVKPRQSLSWWYNFIIYKLTFISFIFSVYVGQVSHSYTALEKLTLHDFTLGNFSARPNPGHVTQNSQCKYMCFPLFLAN